jgi:hypothetical protein
MTLSNLIHILSLSVVIIIIFNFFERYLWLSFFLRYFWPRGSKFSRISQSLFQLCSLSNWIFKNVRVNFRWIILGRGILEKFISTEIEFVVLLTGLHHLIFLIFKFKPRIRTLHLLWSKDSKTLSIFTSLSSFDDTVNIFRTRRVMESNSVRTIKNINQ